MKKLEVIEMQEISGGGVCDAVIVADVVVAGAGLAAKFGLLALNPIGGGILAIAGFGLAIASLGCWLDSRN